MDGPRQIIFGATEDAYNSFQAKLMALIIRERATSVLDIGGGAIPMLTEEFVRGERLEYTVFDISADEMHRASGQYIKVVGDIGDSSLAAEVQYDFVFSRFLAEHVKQGEILHRNVFKMLRPGGVAFHFFPTVFASPFLLNMLLPEQIGRAFLSRERRERGKFAAYYSWCTGPTRFAVKRLMSIGFEIEEYGGFFGHGYYERIPILGVMQKWVKRVLLRYPISFWTSFAWVIVRRPISSDGAREES